MSASIRDSSRERENAAADEGENGKRAGKRWRMGRGTEAGEGIRWGRREERPADGERVTLI